MFPVKVRVQKKCFLKIVKFTKNINCKWTRKNVQHNTTRRTVEMYITVKENTCFIKSDASLPEYKANSTNINTNKIINETEHLYNNNKKK